MSGLRIRIRRVYDPPAAGDGLRVLVDRLWPRGLTKAQARLDLWAKALAPTTALRKWFGHDPARFEDFQTRYVAELQDQQAAITSLLHAAEGRPITLLYAARDPVCNHAVVLMRVLQASAP